MADGAVTGAETLMLVRRVRWALRITLLTVLSAGWIFVAAAFLLLSGTAGKAGGSAWCFAVMTPIVIASWFVAAPPKHRLAITAFVTAGVVLIGLGIYQLASPSIERVDRASSALPVPPEANLLQVDQMPSDWCLQGCSYVERIYAVPDGDIALQELEKALSDDGWLPVGAQWCRGDYSVTASATPIGWVGFLDDPSPPPGEVTLSVVTTVARC